MVCTLNCSHESSQPSVTEKRGDLVLYQPAQRPEVKPGNNLHMRAHSPLAKNRGLAPYCTSHIIQLHR